MCIFVAKKKEMMKELLKRYFDLRADKVPEEVTIANIKADASFRGATLWVLVFAMIGHPELKPDPAEVSEGKWWTPEELDAALGKGILTPNFESEFARIRQALYALL